MNTIKIQDQTYPIRLPDFATREELVESYANSGKAQRTVGYILVAITGVCCPGLLQGLEMGSYEDTLDPLRWGRALYSQLRENEIPTAEVMTQGAELLKVILEDLYPRELEVEEGKPSSPPGEEDRI
jgi:hypothetical protein